MGGVRGWVPYVSREGTAALPSGAPATLVNHTTANTVYAVRERPEGPTQPTARPVFPLTTSADQPRRPVLSQPRREWGSIGVTSSVQRDKHEGEGAVDECPPSPRLPPVPPPSPVDTSVPWAMKEAFYKRVHETSRIPERPPVATQSSDGHNGAYDGLTAGHLSPPGASSFYRTVPSPEAAGEQVHSCPPAYVVPSMRDSSCRPFVSSPEPHAVHRQQ
mmetsp:Transcript_14687/g.42294  ORF Transcript_14687/g.42294 Transcript_14687/m.42294 type:complete len:218 (-) Transcript_14687:2439-3092(-)